MNACELTASITALANVIAEKVCDTDQITLIGAIFTQLGDTLETIAVQKDLCCKKTDE